jgi:hypothetical protein
MYPPAAPPARAAAGGAGLERGRRHKRPSSRCMLAAAVVRNAHTHTDLPVSARSPRGASCRLPKPRQGPSPSPLSRVDPSSLFYSRGLCSTHPQKPPARPRLSRPSSLHPSAGHSALEFEARTRGLWPPESGRPWQTCGRTWRPRPLWHACRPTATPATLLTPFAAASPPRAPSTGRADAARGV